MKKLILFLVISVPVFGQNVLAQNVDYNKIILPDYTKSVDFGEKLVQIAWRNHPSNEAIRRTVNVATTDVRQSSTAWLDLVSVTGNLNQFTLDPQADLYGRSAYWPKYNVRASINLGQFFSIPYTTKRNKELLMIAQANVNTQKLTVRNSVLKAYNEYHLREKMFKYNRSCKWTMKLPTS